MKGLNTTVLVIILCTSQILAQSRGIYIEFEEVQDIYSLLKEQASAIPKEKASVLGLIKEQGPWVNHYTYEYINGKSAFRFLNSNVQHLSDYIAQLRNFEEEKIYLIAAKDTTLGYVDTVECHEWQLVPGETKNIAGYECKKAIFKNSVVWYAEDIPIPDGPGKPWCGLPGMILMCEYSPYHSMTAKRVETRNNIIIEFPKNTKPFPSVRKGVNWKTSDN